MLNIILIGMIVKLNDWSPKFFHQKGWIGNKFMTTNPSAAHRWNKRNHTETRLQKPNQLSPSSFQQNQTRGQKAHKPSTAPSGPRSRVEISQHLERMGGMNSSWEQPPPLLESKYSNFRTSVSNRKQLLYIKPYTRYQSQHLSIDEKKNEVYKAINHPDISMYLDHFQNNSQVIEYLTEYNDPFSSQKSTRPKEKKRMASGNRMSLNILREKLKRKCQPSSYSKKMNAIKFQ